MKKLKLLIFLCILTIATSCGQQKRYVSYTVKDGETMRSIAKQHNLKTKDLLRLNPDVGRKPKASTVIIIPNSKNKNTQIADNLPIDKTPKNSPVVEKIPKIDDIVNTNLELEVLKKNFVIHKVKAKETVYGLTHFYNISKEDLFTLNPTVKKEGLKIGQTIKVKPIETKKDVEANEVFEDNIKSGETVKIVMLLPFRASEYSATSAKDIFRKNGSLANIVTDFYMGAEIAIDSIRKQGVRVDLQVFDTGKKNSRIRSIASNRNLDDADVIIGPFYYEEAKIVANQVKTPVVFPMYSKNQRSLTSSKIVKTAPDKSTYIDVLTSYLSDEFNGENIIVVGDGKSTSNRNISKIVSNLQKNNLIGKISILKPEKRYIKKQRFTNLMKPKTHTWVIIVSEDNVAVADALNSMVSLPKEVTAQVFAIEKNNAFNKIDNFKLANINFGYVTNEYIDESAYATKSFNKKYKKLNNTLPSNYATKGFDITYDVLARLASSENDLKETLNNGSSYRLVSKFDYKKHLFGATNNEGLFIVKYNKDLSLTRLR